MTAGSVRLRNKIGMRPWSETMVTHRSPTNLHASVHVKMEKIKLNVFHFYFRKENRFTPKNVRLMSFTIFLGFFLCRNWTHFRYKLWANKTKTEFRLVVVSGNNCWTIAVMLNLQCVNLRHDLETRKKLRGRKSAEEEWPTGKKNKKKKKESTLTIGSTKSLR